MEMILQQPQVHQNWGIPQSCSYPEPKAKNTGDNRFNSSISIMCKSMAQFQSFILQQILTQDITLVYRCTASGPRSLPHNKALGWATRFIHAGGSGTRRLHIGHFGFIFNYVSNLRVKKNIYVYKFSTLKLTTFNSLLLPKYRIVLHIPPPGSEGDQWLHQPAPDGQSQSLNLDLQLHSEGTEHQPGKYKTIYRICTNIY